MLVLLACIGNPWIMAITLLIYGAISSMPTPAVAAYVSDVVPFRKQKRAYSLQTWAANFGFAIGPIIANQLVKISYSLMFYAEAAVLVFATLLMMAFFKEAGLGVHGVGRSVNAPWNGSVEQPVERSGTAQTAQSQQSKFSIWRSYRRACTDKAPHVDGGADVPVHAGVLPDCQRLADFHDADRSRHGRIFQPADH